MPNKLARELAIDELTPTEGVINMNISEDNNNYKQKKPVSIERLAPATLLLIQEITKLLNDGVILSGTQIEEIGMNLGCGSQSRKSAKNFLLENQAAIRISVGSRSLGSWMSPQTHQEKYSHCREFKATKNNTLYQDLPEISKWARGEFVYFLRRTRDGIYKIGVAKNPRKRAQGIANACGSHLEVVAFKDFCNATDARNTEFTLHSIYDDKRTVGEWFDLFPEEVEAITRTLGGKENEI
ncbi:GIY-YIG nuclease family protein [Scytonema hofmannii]|uniref:GIY-YIG nuclease family protein n=1 Tax=Scytonema hofmannii TaxID=34078 RepID=UPI0013148236|nr:GIY-YIG nuclease family protein [Scytonema hofmannii]